MVIRLRRRLCVNLALTDREKKIKELVAQGLSSYEIARKLGVWPAAVIRSRQNAERKLKRARADLRFDRRLKRRD